MNTLPSWPNLPTSSYLACYAVSHSNATALHRRSFASANAPACIDSMSKQRGLKLPQHSTPMSHPGRVPSISWDGIAQETTPISEEGRGGAGSKGSPQADKL